jgi:hypothetical protein
MLGLVDDQYNSPSCAGLDNEHIDQILVQLSDIVARIQSQITRNVTQEFGGVALSEEQEYRTRFLTDRIQKVEEENSLSHPRRRRQDSKPLPLITGGDQCSLSFPVLIAQIEETRIGCQTECFLLEGDL